MRPSLTHALRALDADGPLCGARDVPLVVALLPPLVSCPECQQALMRHNPPLKALRIDSDAGNKFQVLGEGATEKVFRQEVLHTSKEAGWMAYFTWNSIHSPAGFPDLVLVKPEAGLLIMVELKTAKGRVSKAQRAWLEALAHVTEVVACVWRPGDIDAIRDLLRRA